MTTIITNFDKKCNNYYIEIVIYDNKTKIFNSNNDKKLICGILIKLLGEHLYNTKNINFNFGFISSKIGKLNNRNFQIVKSITKKFSKVFNKDIFEIIISDKYEIYDSNDNLIIPDFEFTI